MYENYPSQQMQLPRWSYTVTQASSCRVCLAVAPVQDSSHEHPYGRCTQVKVHNMEDSVCPLYVTEHSDQKDRCQWWQVPAQCSRCVAPAALPPSQIRLLWFRIWCGFWLQGKVGLPPPPCFGVKGVLLPFLAGLGSRGKGPPPVPVNTFAKCSPRLQPTPGPSLVNQRPCEQHCKKRQKAFHLGAVLGLEGEGRKRSEKKQGGYQGNQTRYNLRQ